jgi:hypothetical protein
MGSAGVQEFAAALEADVSGIENVYDMAQRMTVFMRAALVDDANTPCCPLVRFYITRRFSDLDEDQRAFAAGALRGTEPTPGMKCLVLAGTSGEEALWNSRDQSAGHKAIPLPSATIVAKAPMIASMIAQFGIEIGTLLEPRPVDILALEQMQCNVFYVPEAKGSPLIPAQYQFVLPYRIRTVLGFGGVLPAGELFAAILFSREAVPQTVAELFKGVAVSVKRTMLR